MTKPTLAARRRRAKAKWRAANPERSAAYNKRWQQANRSKVSGYAHKRRYGMTLAERDARLARQGGECAICPTRTARWHTDHDHKTGKVRGILCGPCNHMLGNAGDDPKRLIAAAKYLKLTGTSP